MKDNTNELDIVWVSVDASSFDISFCAGLNDDFTEPQQQNCLDCGQNVDQLNTQGAQPRVQDDAPDFNQHGHQGRQLDHFVQRK